MDVCREKIFIDLFHCILTQGLTVQDGYYDRVDSSLAIAFHQSRPVVTAIMHRHELPLVDCGSHHEYWTESASPPHAAWADEDDL